VCIGKRGVGGPELWRDMLEGGIVDDGGHFVWIVLISVAGLLAERRVICVMTM
jgi:hypothetical protein